MSTATARHIDTADGAKLIRLALKRAFPTTTFRVRINRYSMGSSVYVGWTDGPTTKRVEAALEPFNTKHFDGMDDSTRFTTSWLRGDVVTSWKKPGVEAEEIYFSFYLSTGRSYSPALMHKAAAQIASYYGTTAPVITLEKSRHPQFAGTWNFSEEPPKASGEDWHYLIRQAAEDRQRYAPGGRSLVADRKGGLGPQLSPAAHTAGCPCESCTRYCAGGCGRPAEPGFDVCNQCGTETNEVRSQLDGLHAGECAQ